MRATPVMLDGTPAEPDAQRLCSKCGALANPLAGVQLSPSRWHCHQCWRRPLFASRRKKS